MFRRNGQSTMGRMQHDVHPAFMDVGLSMSARRRCGSTRAPNSTCEARHQMTFMPVSNIVPHPTRSIEPKTESAGPKVQDRTFCATGPARRG